MQVLHIISCSVGPFLPIPAHTSEEFTSVTDYPLSVSPNITLPAHITLMSTLENIGFYSEWLRQKSYLNLFSVVGSKTSHPCVGSVHLQALLPRKWQPYLAMS